MTVVQPEVKNQLEGQNSEWGKVGNNSSAAYSETLQNLLQRLSWSYEKVVFISASASLINFLRQIKCPPLFIHCSETRKASGKSHFPLTHYSSE